MMGNKALNGTSLRETALFYYVKKYVPDAIHRYKFKSTVKTVECDIYSPSLNLAIEYDGGYWHKNKTERDNAKNIILNNNGVYVIRVREFGLPELNSFDGATINLPYLHINEPETYDFINLTLEEINSHFNLNKILTTVTKDVYGSDLINIHSLIYNSNCYPNLTDMCGIEYWDIENNSPLKPDFVPSDAWVPVYLKCPEGRNILLPRYHRKYKSLCAKMAINVRIAFLICFARCYHFAKEKIQMSQFIASMLMKKFGSALNRTNQLKE